MMMLLLTFARLTRSYRHSHRYRSRFFLILGLLSIVFISRSEPPKNDSYGYLDSRFVYSPKADWTLNDTQAGLAYTNYSGANLSTHFFGSAVYLSSSKKADRYILRVTIDGSDHYDVDLNGPDTRNSSPEVLWGVQLVEGNHTLVATNPRVDPDRPYVAFASLTVTTGQPINNSPPVSSTTFHSLQEKEDDHSERNSIIRRVGGAIGALLSFIVLVAIAYRLQRRRHLEQIQNYLQAHRRSLKPNPPDPKPVILAPTLPPSNEHRYVSIRSHTPASVVPSTDVEPNESLLVISEPPITTRYSKEIIDESEFWRPRKASESSG